MDASGLPSGLRWVDAGNAGPFTLEGTRCHIVGRRRVAVVDPGPALPDHVDALATAVAGATEVVILLTHGHADHAGAAATLAARVGAPVLGAWGSGDRKGESESLAAGPPPELAFRPLAEAESVATDEGELVAVRTPGHAREHLVFHWPARRTAFVGDLLLGSGETTWVGAYPGCVSDYFRSLAQVEELEAQLLLPAHGPPIRDPRARIERFRAHRRARLAQVERALAASPEAMPEQLLGIVYGDSVPPTLLPAARASLSALVEHVRRGEG